MHAVFSGHVQASKEILDLGGLVNAAAKDGTNAALLAAASPRLQADQKAAMLKLLRERGANLEAKRQDGLSAVAIAAVQGGAVAEAVGGQARMSGNKLWIAIMSKRGRVRDQSIETSSDFPRDRLQEHWKQGRMLETIHYADGLWVMVTSKPSTPYSQQYLLVPTWPTKQIAEYEHQGFKVTSVVHDGSQYLLVLTKLGDGRDFKWVQHQSKDLSGTRGVSQFGNDFMLFDTVPGKDVWIVGAYNQTGFTNQDPPYLSKQFPAEHIREKWAAGYDITSLSYGLGTWSLIMSKGTGIKEQTWVSGEAFPAKEIAAMQANGFHVDLITKG